MKDTASSDVQKLTRDVGKREPWSSTTVVTHLSGDGEMGRDGEGHPFKLAGKKDGTKVGKGKVCLTFGIIIFLTSKRGKSLPNS